MRRGYNFLAFEGPGQGQVVRRRRRYFRHDWEKVVSPAIDYLLERREVDPKRLVLYGLSMGGYLAPRAAAFEHRLAACIANGGIFDVFDANTAKLGMSREERVQLVLTRPEEVDRFTCEAMRDSIGVHWGVTHGMFAFGAKSPGELLSKQISWTLEGVAEGIMCPTLVIDVENEQFFGSQAQKLHGALKCPKSLTIFRSSEGADLHCQAGALLLSNQRIFGWVDETLKSMG